MDARLWHQQATMPKAVWPDPVDDIGSLEDPGTYRDRLEDALDAMVWQTEQTHLARNAMTHAVERGARKRRGAQLVLAVNGRFTSGKSTFVKDWGAELHRRWLSGQVTHKRPTWQPEPHLTADLVPVIYVTLRAASAIKEVNAQILSFLRYPSEGVTRATTTRVQEALSKHGVRLVIIDDVHMLRAHRSQGRDVLDYLKYLNSELGELGGTLVLIGAEMHSGPIYMDPQIRSRLRLIELGPVGIGTDDGMAEWQRLLGQVEKRLLPYVPKTEAGVFSRENASYIWRRTQGYLGDAAALVSGALLGALDAGEAITHEHLRAVPLSVRAQEAEADDPRPDSVY